MNVSFLFNAFRTFVIKAGAKVQLLFTLASAFENNFFILFSPIPAHHFKEPDSLRFVVSGSAKIQPHFVSGKCFL
jgi:hypothetical protein